MEQIVEAINNLTGIVLFSLIVFYIWVLFNTKED